MTPQLQLIRRDLNELPDIRLPDGYKLTSYRSGYSNNWREIIAASFELAPEKFDFEKSIRKNPFFREERVKFICYEGKPIATCSAFHRADYLPEYGMIHYLGALPGHKGKKLGYWIMLACLHQMKKDGFTGSWLSTDDFRLPAIKTYLNLGYVPFLVDCNQRDRWRKVLENLKIKNIKEKYGNILDGDIYQKI